MTAIDPNLTIEEERSVWARLAATFLSNPSFALGSSVLFLIVLSAGFAPVLAPFDPTAINFAERLTGPSATHWFGTDQLGRDIFSQVLFGARLSILVGFVAVLIALLVGLPIGLISGYFGGWIDTVLMRVSDVFLAFPPLLLPIVITAALGPGLINVMIAVGISWFPWYARILRASVLSVREELYVKAAKASGLSHGRIMINHVFPNSLTPVMVQASMDFGYTMLAAASLSFIGLGARPPAIEWGLMVSQARSLVIDYWWTATFPGLAIFVTVLSVNLVGDGLRNALDPTYRERI